MCFYRTQGNTHHIGYILILHVVQVAELKYFFTLIRKFVYCLPDFRTQFAVLYPLDNFRMIGLIVFSSFLIELYFGSTVVFGYGLMFQQIDCLGIDRPVKKGLNLLAKFYRILPSPYFDKYILNYIFCIILSYKASCIKQKSGIVASK